MLSYYHQSINQFEVDNLYFHDSMEHIRGFKEKRKPRNQLNSG